YRPRMVVFPVLAAAVLQLTIQVGPLAFGAATGGGLRMFDGGQRFRGMASARLHTSGDGAQDRPTHGDAHMCVSCCPDRGRRRITFGLARCWPAEPCGCCAPRMVRQYFYDGFRYVSCTVRGDGCELRPGRRSAGRGDISTRMRPYCSTHTQL